MSNYFGSYFGDSSASGGTYTDPGVANVRLATGYTYNGVSQTGTLALPDVADVRLGTGYGAGGTEFTGTLAGGGGTDWTAPERATILAAVGAILAGGVSLSVAAPTPVVGSLIVLVQGDDYAVADGKALAFTALTAEDLSGATWAWTLYRGANAATGTEVAITATATAVAGGYSVLVPLTHLQTAAMAASATLREYAMGAVTSGPRAWELVVTRAGGRLWTPLIGTAAVVG